jgi:hypothetical protein
MKSDKSIEIFYKICEHIITYNKLYNGKLYPKFFYKSQTSNYKRYKLSAENRGINFYLTEKETNTIFNKKCNYCGNFSEGCSGIDRINSDLDYTIKNCVPCCTTCNFLKLNFNQEQFIEKCLIIVFKKNGLLYTPNIIEGIEEKLRKDFENIKFVKETNNNLINYKFDKNYYETKIWNGNINDLNNIKIKLEFANSNDKLKDLWLYYRNTTSSLPFQRDSKLVGRQIYVLVKDENSNKYLGILSLSSDIKNMQNRDDYIGWSFEDRVKNKKLNYIMNMSTCVPLQPFGFNFTGGKLLTKLAFSQEIKNYYKELYNNELLGITTTGLYGKSIQYDRLKELKFLGYTKGNSVYKIPNELVEKCKKFLISKGKNYTKKFFVIGQTLHYLGLSRDMYMSDTPKGIYFGFCNSNAKDFLIGKIKNIEEDPKISNIKDIFEDWKNIYAIKRYNHLKLTNRIKYDNIYDAKENTKNINIIKKDKIINSKNLYQGNKDYFKKYYLEKKEIKNIPDNKIIFQKYVSLFKEKESFYLQYIKKTPAKVYRKKIKVKSENIQEEVERLIKELNNDNPGYEAKPEPVINSKIFTLNKKLNENSEIDINILPPSNLPENFSICKIKGIDYLQYNKIINKMRNSDRIRINSYDMDKEINEFIKRINEKFNENHKLIKDINSKNWKTTNKILNKEITEQKIKNSNKQKKYINKIKTEIGDDAFNKLKAEKAKERRENKKNVK